MNVLLVYGTYSGGTLHAAEIIAETLQARGHAVTVKPVRETKPEDFAAFTYVIFGTNTWLENKKEGSMNGGYYALKEKLKGDELAGKKCAVYGLGELAPIQHNVLYVGRPYGEFGKRITGHDIRTFVKSG